MKKFIAPIFLIFTLTGCGQSINCHTPEVKQIELQFLQDSFDDYFGDFNIKVQIEITTQFIDIKTSKITCQLDLSLIFPMIIKTSPHPL